MNMGWNNWRPSGEGDETRNRLAAWSLILSQQTAPDDYFGNMSSWSVVRVGEELPNLRAAITWLLGSGERELGPCDSWPQRRTSGPSGT